MPTLEDNHRFWGRDYDWAQGGDEWSGVWGGAEMQWFGTLLPHPSVSADRHHPGNCAGVRTLDAVSRGPL